MAGKVVHIELPAQDTSRAREFWGSLMGWQFQAFEGPVEYHMFEGEPGGGIYPQQQGEKGPIVYFGVDDINAETQRIPELGGAVVSGPDPIPGMGWYAHFTDPEGNYFALFQPDESAPAPEGAPG